MLDDDDDWSTVINDMEQQGSGSNRPDGESNASFSSLISFAFQLAVLIVAMHPTFHLLSRTDDDDDDDGFADLLQTYHNHHDQQEVDVDGESNRFEN